MEMARKVGTFKNFVSGRCSEATVVAACEKHAAVLRYLATIDPTGEVYNDHRADVIFYGTYSMLC